MKTNTNFSRYIYWMDKADLDDLKGTLSPKGYKISSVLKTPCEVLNASAEKLLYASPSVWSRVCVRQGSWYRQSYRNGKYMLASEHLLPDQYERFLDVEITEHEFTPEKLPDQKELTQLVAAPQYTTVRPDEWEKPGIKDSIMFKTLFTLTGFWGWGDNMKKHWLGQRANHANFLSNKYTTEVDGQQVPYSVTDNDGVCSACVEFFNVITENSRKLVRACPGSVTFGGVKRKQYYDVKPLGLYSEIPVKTVEL